jgi:hypothetical protein
MELCAASGGTGPAFKYKFKYLSTQHHRAYCVFQGKPPGYRKYSSWQPRDPSATATSPTRPAQGDLVTTKTFSPCATLSKYLGLYACLHIAVLA